MNPEFEAILASNLPDIDKLVQAFSHILAMHEASSKAQIELFKVLGDDQALIKEQIKQSTLKHSQEILTFCYTRITGRKPSDA